MSGLFAINSRRKLDIKGIPYVVGDRGKKQAVLIT